MMMINLSYLHRLASGLNWNVSSPRYTYMNDTVAESHPLPPRRLTLQSFLFLAIAMVLIRPAIRSVWISVQVPTP